MLVIKRGTGTNAVITNYSAVTGTPVTFTLSAKGGKNNNDLESFQDEIIDASKLSLQSTMVIMLKSLTVINLKTIIT